MACWTFEQGQVPIQHVVEQRGRDGPHEGRRDQQRRWPKPVFAQPCMGRFLFGGGALDSKRRAEVHLRIHDANPTQRAYQVAGICLPYRFDLAARAVFLPVESIWPWGGTRAPDPPNRSS